MFKSNPECSNCCSFLDNHSYISYHSISVDTLQLLPIVLENRGEACSGHYLEIITHELSQQRQKAHL